MNQPRENAESFAEALEASLNFKKPEQGELLRGTIVSISGDDAFVAYGGPTEAIISAEEIGDAQVGDSIEATVIQTSPDIRISRKMLAKRASIDALRAVYQNGVPVEGKIAARNKGGYDVVVSGMRAFCPLSQIALGKIENPDEYIGKSLEFRITELSDDGRKFVVSRSALLKQEASARADEARKTIVPGAIVTGRVKNLMPFGAFVDLGGVEGLLHVSEMSRRRINDPKEVVTTGQEVTVKIIKVESDGKRISLSMKEFEADPWQGVEERYPVGSTFSGKVARTTDFGLFVELEPGIDGLVHLSQLPLGLKMNDESIAVGATVTGWVREIDTERRRISLAMRQFATEDPWQNMPSQYATGRVMEGVVERAGGPGVFVELEPGLTGLVPNSELNLPPNTDAARHFKSGEKMRVKILSIDHDRKRISLTQDSGEEADSLEVAEFAQARSNDGGKSAMQLALEKAMEKKN